MDMYNVAFTFANEDTARSFRIMGEFTYAFEKLGKLGDAVTIFGSARTKPANHYYKEAVKLGEKLARNKIATVTGGGPGIMEAANRGAAKGKYLSVGLNIQLPMEQCGNKYVNYPVNFHYFFCRKVCLVRYSMAFVFFPGGFGTMDEAFEILTLVQTRRIGRFPLIFVGKKYWSGLLKWLDQTMEGNKYISPGDTNLMHVVDSADQAFKIIFDYHMEHHGYSPSDAV